MLEFCLYYGCIGFCVEVLVEVDVKKVVIVILDFNFLVVGNGVEILENVGIEVIIGVCEEELC